jgi:hypothetical protein
MSAVRKAAEESTEGRRVLDLVATAEAEKREQDQRLLTDRLRAIESFAHEAKESMLEGCAEVQEGLSYLVAFDVIELLAREISEDVKPPASPPSPAPGA